MRLISLMNHSLRRRWSQALCLLAVGAGNYAFAADWPEWRGPQRDGHTTESLPAALPANPRANWKKSVGHGYAAVVVRGDRLFFADDADGKETLHALLLKDGQKLWSTAVAPVWNDEFENGPRCTPVVADGRVFFQSNQGEFVAVEAATGRRIWGFNFKDYGTFWVSSPNSGVGAANRRGNVGSPVVRGNRVVVQVGSTNNASLCAFDVTDGRLLWRSQNDLTSFSTPVVATLAGTEQVITATVDGLLGVALTDGRKLWRVPFKTGANRNVLTPVIDGDTVTFSSHTTGMRRVRVTASGSSQRVNEEWFNQNIRVNLSTPVLVGDHLFGLGPSKNYICFDRARGEIRWSEEGFGAVASTITKAQ